MSNSRISKASGIAKLHEYGPSSRTAYRKVVEDSGWWADTGIRRRAEIGEKLKTGAHRGNAEVYI